MERNSCGNAIGQLNKIKTQLQSLTGKARSVVVNAKNAIGGKVNELVSDAMMGLGAPLMGAAGTVTRSIFTRLAAVQTNADAARFGRGLGL